MQRIAILAVRTDGLRCLLRHLPVPDRPVRNAAQCHGRIGFKDWLKQRLPASAERSVYVLLASLVLIFLFWQWRPIPGIIWSAESGAGQAVG